MKSVRRSQVTLRRGRTVKSGWTMRDERVIRVVQGATSDRREGHRESNQNQYALGADESRRRTGAEDSRPKLSVQEMRFDGRSEIRAGSSMLPGGPGSISIVSGCSRHTEGMVCESTPTHSPLVPRIARPLPTRSNLYATLYLLEYHRGTLEILTYLNQEGCGTVSDMRKQLMPGPEAIRGALSVLLQLALIESSRASRIPFARIYRLTEKGKAVLGRPLINLTGVLSD